MLFLVSTPVNYFSSATKYLGNIWHNTSKRYLLRNSTSVCTVIHFYGKKQYLFLSSQAKCLTISWYDYFCDKKGHNFKVWPFKVTKAKKSNQLMFISFSIDQQSPHSNLLIHFYFQLLLLWILINTFTNRTELSHAVYT